MSSQKAEAAKQLWRTTYPGCSRAALKTRYFRTVYHRFGGRVVRQRRKVEATIPLQGLPALKAHRALWCGPVIRTEDTRLSWVGKKTEEVKQSTQLPLSFQNGTRQLLRFPPARTQSRYLSSRALGLHLRVIPYRKFRRAHPTLAQAPTRVQRADCNCAKRLLLFLRKRENFSGSWLTVRRVPLDRSPCLVERG